ncbi:MAG TPA: exodeoxyribonuclease VII small subunit [Actinobacteria bacterium]|nr:exodeoxyribonuclease VII small subunit [Actinomycetota bacterium]
MVGQLEKLSYDHALDRLEEIAEQVRKKEISLEASLDLLEESIQLATLCNQQIDYTAWIPQNEEDSPGEDIVDR